MRRGTRVLKMRRKERDQETGRKEGKEQDVGQGRAGQGRMWMGCGWDGCAMGWMRDRMLSKVGEQNRTELNKRGTQ